MRRRYHPDDPDPTRRLERGIHLALVGAVVWSGRAHGALEVRGYIVGPAGRCTCPDARLRGRGKPWFCKHAIAAFVAAKMGLVRENSNGPAEGPLSAG